MDIPPKFISWCKTCVCHPSFSVSINGSVSGYFKGKAGLRQGDPLSPTLFVIAINILSLMLNKAATQGRFGYHKDYNKLKLMHLCFADDLLVFLDGTERSIQAVLEVLEEFKSVFGLSMNLDKTSTFMAGFSNHEKDCLTAKFGLKEAVLPVRYLGMSLCSSKLTHADCEPLLSRISSKLSSWTVKLLSFAGRIQLLSTVIAGIIAFWASAFMLPKSVLKLINTYSANSFGKAVILHREARE